ncbi:MAG: tRNA lysidine(34) synthetase TilS [bacterium]|nr:tRNA lysidine(34) synthetase TilS [bacterium]
MKGEWFVKRIATAIERLALVEAGQGVLIGVSGGPDSVALLHAMSALASSHGWRLWVGHLDHALRHHEAAADAEYVRELAARLGLEHVAGRTDVAALARQEGLSLESAGRQARYAFFREQARRHGLARVALGHTLDDQAETVLLRLIRGAGVEGLAAMPWMRPLAGEAEPAVIRPLLGMSRDDILEYCAELDLRPRVDTSNESLEFWRNRVRHSLIPLLEQEFAPNIKEILARTAAICREEATLLARDTEQAMAGTLLEMGEGRVVFDRDRLGRQHRARARRILRRALAVAGVAPGLEYGHVEALLGMVSSGAAGAALDLPGGFAAVLETGDRMVVAREWRVAGPSWKAGRVLAVPGDTDVPELGVRIRTGWLTGDAARRAVEEGLSPRQAICDAGALDFPLLVRSRREGDRFRPLGMQGTRKLKDFFMSAGVPRTDRDRVPLVVSAGQIVWVAGHRPDDRFRVTGRTSSALSLECRPIEIAEGRR